jgi:segregation and condensation protein B
MTSADREAETSAAAAPDHSAEEQADQLRLLEALLFASATPLDEAAIKLRLPDGANIPALMADLDLHYRERGVHVVKTAGGWTLRTATDLAPRLKLVQKVQRRLSRAAIETLAIVAYHQPVTRAEIEDIRGVVVSSGTLDNLMEVGWIAPKGRRQAPGRPVTWVTTETFLLHFGLAELGDLPGMEELRAAGLIGPRPDFALRETGSLAEMPLNPGEVDAGADEAERAEREAAEEIAASPAASDDDDDDSADADDAADAEPAGAGKPGHDDG